MFRKLLLPLALLLAVAGCLPRTGSTETGGVPQLSAPEVAVAGSGGSIVSFDPPGSGARVLVRVPIDVRNPGRQPLELLAFTYTYSLGTETLTAGLGREHGTMPLRLAPGASTRLSLLLSGELRRDVDLLRQSADAFGDAGAGLPFRVTGTLSYTAPAHPFAEEQEIALSGSARPEAGPELPVLRLLSADSAAWSVTADEAHVRLLIEVGNPGTAGWLLQARSLWLHVDGVPLAAQSLPPTPVAAGGSTTVALPFRLERELLSPRARRLLSDLLSGSEVSVSLHGEMSVDVLGLGSFRLEAEPALEAVFNAD